MDLIAFWFGMVGMVLILISYYLISSGKTDSKSLFYQICNLLGAIGIMVSTFYTKSWPSFILNVIWSVIAIYAIWKIIFTKK